MANWSGWLKSSGSSSTALTTGSDDPDIRLGDVADVVDTADGDEDVTDVCGDGGVSGVVRPSLQSVKWSLNLITNFGATREGIRVNLVNWNFSFACQWNPTVDRFPPNVVN